MLHSLCLAAWFLVGLALMVTIMLMGICILIKRDVRLGLEEWGEIVMELVTGGRWAREEDPDAA